MESFVNHFHFHLTRDTFFPFKASTFDRPFNDLECSSNNQIQLRHSLLSNSFPQLAEADLPTFSTFIFTTFDSAMLRTYAISR